MNDDVMEVPTKATEQVTPVAVAIVADVSEKLETAAFGGWSCTHFAGTAADTPVQILRFDTRRKRAVIQCSPGIVSGQVAGTIFVGSKAQICNGNPSGSGAMLTNGIQFVVESASEIWAMSDGVHELSVSVLDEIYRT